MKSIFTDKVDRRLPLPEYPRPQLRREPWQNLNGVFDYAITGADAGRPESYDGEILVPFAPECPLSGVEKHLLPEQLLWYRRLFTLSDGLRGKNVLLHFGAVDWQCEVWVNGSSVGRHTGGYTAFTFDITAFLREGENELTLRVCDPTDEGWQQRGKQVGKPHGIWYTATSGIWQTVWLEGVDPCHIEKLKLTPNIDAGELHIQTFLSRAGEGASLEAVVSEDGKELLSRTISRDDRLSLPFCELWSPENPKLYGLRIRAVREGKTADEVESYFGMRKFHAAKDSEGHTRLFLNNRPYFQRGLLDQGYWCDGGLTAPTDEAMIFDISEMKRLGFNLLRKHIKTEPLRWYYHCDRLGMLVWQDMMSGGRYIGDFYAGFLPNIGLRGKVSDGNYARFKRNEGSWRKEYLQELDELIGGLYNVVSIFCWTPFNEGWGQFDALKVCEHVRSLDDSRVIDHASGWYDRGGGDILSIHRYILPVRLPKMDGRAFVLTEFGGYSRVVGGHAWNEKKAFGYLMFRTKESLTRAYKKLLEKQVIPLIRKGLAGTIYTQLSDVENEVNGLYTYDRACLKIDEKTLTSLNEKMRC